MTGQRCSDGQNGVARLFLDRRLSVPYIAILTLAAVGFLGCRGDEGDSAAGSSSPITEVQPSGTISPAEANLEVPLVDGQELYEYYCAACHGAEGMGDGPVAANLKTPTPDLTTLSQRSGVGFPGQMVERYIRNETGPDAHGTPEMPLWGPIFVEKARLDEQTRDKLRVLLGSEVTSPFLADLRVSNLVAYIESLQR